MFIAEASSQMSTFKSTLGEMIPVFPPYKTTEVRSLNMCAIWCQQEVDCVTFALTSRAMGSVTCLMYDRRPLTFDLQREAEVATMVLVRTIHR